MKVITAIEEYTKQENDICVFLAGGITNCPEWQDEVIEGLKNIDPNKYRISFDDLVIFNPRRKNFPIHDPNASEEQIKWEFRMLEQCDIFSMYFSGGESDQPICMYELGRNIVRIQNKFPASWDKRIVVTSSPNYRRYKDVIIQTTLATNNILSEENITGNLAEHIERIALAYCFEFVRGAISDGIVS